MRIVAGLPPVLQVFLALFRAPVTGPGLGILRLVAAACAALLLVGSWTPIAGLLMAAAELSLYLMHPSHLWTHLQLGALGAALAMLGPGAVSVDAQRFGRKRIQSPRR